MDTQRIVTENEKGMDITTCDSMFSGDPITFTLPANSAKEQGKYLQSSGLKNLRGLAFCLSHMRSLYNMYGFGAKTAGLRITGLSHVSEGSDPFNGRFGNRYAGAVNAYISIGCDIKYAFTNGECSEYIRKMIDFSGIMSSHTLSRTSRHVGSISIFVPGRAGGYIPTTNSSCIPVIFEQSSVVRAVCCNCFDGYENNCLNLNIIEAVIRSMMPHLSLNYALLIAVLAYCIKATENSSHPIDISSSDIEVTISALRATGCLDVAEAIVWFDVPVLSQAVKERVVDASA